MENSICLLENPTTIGIGWEWGDKGLRLARTNPFLCLLCGGGASLCLEKGACESDL